MTAPSIHRRDAGAARTRALFREINNRVAELSADLGAMPAGFVCECTSLDCAVTIPLRLEDYADVRDDPACFIVAEGHERNDLEAVFARGDGYLVVRERDPFEPEMQA